MPSPLIASRYAVQKVLGKGGGGQTLLVSDRFQGDLPFVLKVLNVSCDRSAVDEEFQILKSLYHPNIVEVISSGHLEDSSKAPYLVMEWIDGCPLDQAGISLEGDASSWEPVAQICRTLSYIHSKNVVHGDLKPSNILFLRDGLQTKVIDFGLARLSGRGAAKELPAGTLAYMAPEVIAKGDRTAKSDLYSLGILLYQLLSGQLPFNLNAQAAVTFHLHEEADLGFLARHPWKVALETILRRLLHKDPSKRPSDPLEVLTTLNDEAKAGLAIHRGWQETGGEGLFFQKIHNYLDSVNQLLRLSSVSYPRSFLEEERQRIQKYLDLAQGLSSQETADCLDRLEETKVRILLQEGRYQEVTALKEGGPALRNVQALAEIYLENYERAEAILQEVLRQAPGEADRARAENYLGIAAYNCGRLDEARVLFERSLKEMSRLQDTTGIVSNEMNLAAIAQQQGRIADAMQLYKEALEAARALKNSFLLAILLSNIANLHLHVGALEEAEEHLQKSRSLARELNLSLLEGYDLLLAADIAMWRKEFVKADRHLEEAMEIFRKTPSPMYTALAWINYAENSLRGGRAEDLPDRLAKAANAVSRTNLPEPKLRLEIVKLHSRIRRGEDLDALVPLLQRLEKRARTSQEKLQTLVAKGHWALAKKDLARCETILNEAKGLFEERQREVPIGYQSRLIEAPRYAFLWELQDELARKRKAPADASLWKLIAINKRLVSARNPAKLQEQILDDAIELCGAERGFLIMPEFGKWKRGTWKVQAARRMRHQELPGGRDLLSKTVINKVLEGRKPLLVHNAQEETDFCQFKSVMALRLRSILAVPIVVHGEMAGALYLDHSDAVNLFSEKDLEILKAFADQAGIALTNARYYEESIRRQAALEEVRGKLEETNQRLEEELKKKSLWADRIEEELKKVQEAGPIIARSPVMRHIVKQLRPIAVARRPVVLTGEIGTGRGLIAQTLHGLGKGGPFVRRGARELAPDGARRADELFAGLVEEAQGGTLVLDDLTDLTPAYQREILHLLKSREELDDQSVLVVLLSRLSLKEGRGKGLVIPELAQYLSGAEIRIPPLRERKEEIGPLVRHFLRELDEKRGFPREITRSAMGILHEYDWPGNIHELKLEIEKAALASHLTIEPFDLSPNLLGKTEFVPGAPKKGSVDLRETRGRFERDSILQALERSRWNKVRAAKRLGLSRAMLYLKMRRYKIPLK